MKNILFEMFLIAAFALCISLLCNALSPSGLRILPKKKFAVGGMHRTERAPIHAHARSYYGVVR